MKARWALVGACAVGLALWALWRGSPRTKGSQRAAITAVDETRADATTRAITQPGALLSGDEAPAGSTARAAKGTFALSFLVLDEDSRGIGGVEASWTELLDLGQLKVQAFGAVDARRVSAATVSSTSDAQGRVTFAEPPMQSLQDKSAVWLTNVGFEAELLLLDADRQSWQALTACSLRRREALEVSVVDASRRPVADAVVEHVGFRPIDDDASKDAVRAFQLFRRSIATDASGVARLAPLDGWQGVRAIKDGEQSVPWFGSDAGSTRIQLELGSTFTVHGLITVGGAAPDASLLRVRAFVATGIDRTPVMQCAVRADLSWGPVDIPLLRETTYDFQLDGGGLVPCLEEVPSPGPSAVVEVDFETTLGIDVRVRVVDAETKEPVSRATVFVLSLVDDQWVTSQGSTDEHGNAAVAGCAPGTIDVRASKSGFVENRAGFLTIAADSEPVEIELERAGRIAGRCTHAGKPLEDFEVVYWQEDPQERSSQSFSGRVDGSFEIADAPLGEVTVVAITSDLPRSTPERIIVTADQVARVELDLGDGVVGRGRIIDAATSEPIGRAEIQLYVTQAATLAHPHGAARRTDDEGRFEIPNLTPGLAKFVAGADGYAHRIIDVYATPGAVLEIGTIALERRTRCEVHLIAGRDFDFSGYSVWMRGSEHYPHASFDARGVASFAGVAPGRWVVQVEGPNGGWRALVVEVASGRPCIVEVPVDGDRSLTVELVAAPGASLPDRPWLELEYVDRLGIDRSDGLSIDAASSTAHVENLTATRVTIVVFDDDGNIAAARSVVLTPGENLVRVELDPRRLRIRVVDASRSPVKDCAVYLIGVDDPSGWRIELKTNPAGELELAVPPFDRLLVHMFHAQHGSRMGVVVPVPPTLREPIEIELAPKGRVRIALTDGTTPISGATVELGDFVHQWFAAERRSDDAGHVEIAAIDTEHAVVDVKGAGLWRDKFVVASSESDAYIPLQVRRTGGVELEVRSVAGAAIVDAPVALRSLEFDVDVADWIAAGRVVAPAGGLRTDPSGRVRVEGLPHGPYRASVGGGSSTVEVPAHAVGHAQLVVP